MPALMRYCLRCRLTSPRISPLLMSAHKAMERGRRLIGERQKLIRITYSSERGWSVVVEYTVDELADDCDDENWLEKAKKSAERKALKHRRDVQSHFPPCGPINLPCHWPLQ